MRAFRLFMATILAAVVGTVPACGTMGGAGGMKYLVSSASAVVPLWCHSPTNHNH